MENNNSIEDSNENVDHSKEKQVNNDDINIDIIEYKQKKKMV